MSKPLTATELEIAKLKHMAKTMDLIFAAFDRPTTSYEIDVTCPMCGGRELRHTRNPGAAGSVMAVCSKCSGA